MKKIFTLSLCLLLFGLLTVNGTFAFPNINEIFADLTQYIEAFVDRFNPNPEQDTTQFEVGIVSLARGENGLEPTDEQPLFFPAFTPGALTMTTYTDGDYTYPMWSGLGISDRFVAVKNLSEKTQERPNNAYFRVAVALQKEAADIIYLHFNGNQQDFKPSEWNDIKIGGRDFCMIVYTYLHALPAGEISPAALLQVAVDKKATNEDFEKLSSDFLQIQVMAINADDFVSEVNGVEVQMSAEEALGYAVPLTATFNPFN